MVVAARIAATVAGSLLIWWIVRNKLHQTYPLFTGYLSLFVAASGLLTIGRLPSAADYWMDSWIWFQPPLLLLLWLSVVEWRWLYCLDISEGERKRLFWGAWLFGLAVAMFSTPWGQGRDWFTFMLAFRQDFLILLFLFIGMIQLYHWVNPFPVAGNSIWQGRMLLFHVGLLLIGSMVGEGGVLRAILLPEWSSLDVLLTVFVTVTWLLWPVGWRRVDRPIWSLD